MLSKVKMVISKIVRPKGVSMSFKSISVPDAMQSIKNGVLIIQVPLKSGKTYENFNLTSKKERLEAFGQEDHVRVYGQKSLEEKLSAFKFNVEIIDIAKNFREFDKKYYGISEKEIIFKCVK